MQHAATTVFETHRKDNWWVGPLLTVLGLGTFAVYSTWAAFQGVHYQWGPYLSPFYSPLIVVEWWHFSPAFLILWAPGGFRATCYYYRKAYYRSFFLTPPGCAVTSRPQKYSGETKLPFIIQNIHRYFLYLALCFNILLWKDAIEAFHFEDGFGIGVGSMVLTLNAFLLMCYSLSCHCFRHLMGGKYNCFSTKPSGGFTYSLWTFVSKLNAHHMAFAWTSLFVVGFSDLYIRMCSMGIWTDYRIF